MVRLYIWPVNDVSMNHHDQLVLLWACCEVAHRSRSVSWGHRESVLVISQPVSLSATLSQSVMVGLGIMLGLDFEFVLLTFVPIAPSWKASAECWFLLTGMPGQNSPGRTLLRLFPPPPCCFGQLLTWAHWDEWKRDRLELTHWEEGVAPSASAF
jgi:hypothetical protein